MLGLLAFITIITKKVEDCCSYWLHYKNYLQFL